MLYSTTVITKIDLEKYRFYNNLTDLCSVKKHSMSLDIRLREYYSIDSTKNVMSIRKPATQMPYSSVSCIHTAPYKSVIHYFTWI